MRPFIIILAWFSISSCSYTIVRHKDNNGTVCRERAYKNDIKQSQYFDRIVYKHWYQNTDYPRPGYLNVLNDTTIMSDSVTFSVDNNCSEIVDIFSKGIISGNVFDSVSGGNYTTERINLETGDTTHSKKIYNYYIRGYTILNHVKTPKHHLRLKLRIQPKGCNPSIYYIDLENTEYVAEDTVDIEHFISGARLTFITKWSTEI